MFILRLRRSSSCIQYAENMPPYKKLKTSEIGNENKSETTSKTEVDSVEDFGADWRAQCRSVSDINSYALKKSILTDVTFNVGEESTEFHAHRLILALGSPVFEAMFYGTLAEKGDIITIPDVYPEGFRNLLRFIYFDDISFQNDVIAFKTYFAADKYCITHLKERCEKYLCSYELMPSNVWIYLESSQYLNSQAIKDRCITFLQRYTEAALQDKSFLNVSANTLETLLCLDALNIPEINLLLNVVRWAEYNSNADTAEQGNFLKDILMPHLRLIRFGALTAPQFISFLESQKLKELLIDRDALDILKHINQPLLCRLPDWCCTKVGRDYTVEKRCKYNTTTCSSDKPKITCKEKDLSQSKSRIHFISLPSSSTSSFAATSSSSSSSSSTSVSSDSDEHDSESDCYADI